MSDSIMNLIQLIKKIEEVYNSNEYIESVINADPYYCYNNNEVKYMSVCFDIMSADVEENLITYNIKIYCADRLDDAQDNRNFIYQNTMTQILNGLHEIEKDEDIIEVKYPRHFDFASQKFADVLGCCYCDFSVTLINEFDKC